MDRIVRRCFCPAGDLSLLQAQDGVVVCVVCRRESGIADWSPRRNPKRGRRRSATKSKDRSAKTKIAAGPVSRILSAAHKERQGDHSSRPCITARLQRPTRKLWRTEPARSRRSFRSTPSCAEPKERRDPPLFGLAPCGVCPATAIAGGAVRSYRTFSPLPRRLPSRKRIA